MKIRVNFPWNIPFTFLIRRLFIILAGIGFFLTPLLEASWDVWSKTIIHLIFISSFFFFFLSCFLKNKIYIPPKKLTFIVLILILWLFLTTITSEITFNSEIEFHSWLNYIIVFLLTGGSLYYGVRFFKYFLYGLLILFIFGFYQIFWTTDRVRSTMLNPNIYAGYIIIVLPVLYALIYREIKKRNIKVALRKPSVNLIFSFILLFSGIFQLFMTGSYGAIIALLCSILIVKYRRAGVLLSLIIFFTGILFKLDDRELLNRVYWWIYSLRIFVDFPVKGVGPGNFECIMPVYSTGGLLSQYSHSYYLQILCETGLAGLLFLLIFFIYSFKKIKNNFIKIGLLACLINNIYDYNLLIPANSIIFFAMLSDSWRHCYKVIILNKTKKYYFLYGVVIFLLVYSYSILTINYSVQNYSIAKNMMESRTDLYEKDLKKIEKHLKKSINIKKNNWYSYDKLSELYLYKYSIKEEKSYLIDAIIELEKAVSLNRFKSQYYFRLAGMYKILGEKEKSKEYLRQSYKIKRKL